MSFLKSIRTRVFAYVLYLPLIFQIQAQEVESTSTSIVPPVFSETSGFFDGNIELSLTHPDPNAIIVSTLEGSQSEILNINGKEYNYKNTYPEMPEDELGEKLTANYISHTYEGSILQEPKSGTENKLANISTTYSASPDYFPTSPVLKASVVRAKAIVDGQASKTITHTFFIAEENEFDFSLPVISLNLNEDDFFDYNDGIHVAGVDFDEWRLNNPNNESPQWSRANFKRRGRETEKLASFQYFEDGQQVLSQNIGVRIYGSQSRNQQTKNLRLYALSAYDEQNRFFYPFFGEGSLF